MNTLIEQDEVAGLNANKVWDLFTEEEKQEVIKELAKVVIEDMGARILAKMTAEWEDSEKLTGE
jgi:putative heme iron utilization protein